VKFAPKRKLIDFAMPKWRNKIGEFDSPDKVFPVRAEFNRAYDEGCCNWEEDLDAFEEERSRTRPRPRP
jgi:hypothetical protein